MARVAFQRFRPELIQFLKELGSNNNREWFQAHRVDYEHYLLEPARECVTAMGPGYVFRLPGGHPRAEWLGHSGLSAAFEQPVPEQTFSDRLPELCFEHAARFAPLQQWLVDLLPE
jgi:hypothetical protein